MTTQIAIPTPAQTRSAPLRDAHGRFISSAKASAPSGDIPTTGRAVSQPGQPQGIYTGLFDTYIPRVQDPMFYETLREAIPILDTAVNRYAMLDGVVEIDCGSDALQNHADEWSQSVQLNDIQLGFQSACSQWRGEMYEQGFGLLEFVANEERNDITRLIVPDSKEIWYHREKDGSLTVWFQPGLRALRQYTAPHGQVRAIIHPVWNQSGYVAFDKNRAVKLNLVNIVLGHNRPENSKPHGVSVMRSIPFVAKILTTLNNQVANVWERFGDPAYVVVYKSGGRKPDKVALKEINDQIATDLKTMIAAKRNGRSADMVRTIGKDDEFNFNVVGADGKVLSVEGDGNLMIDQIVSGTGLCRTILNLPTQIEERAGINSALFEARVRFESQRPLLSRPVATMFRLRGVKTKPGDWRLKQVQPDFDDILKKSQARFMDAQRISVYGVSFPDDPAPFTRKKTCASPSQKKRLGKIIKTQDFPEPLVKKTTAAVHHEWKALLAGIGRIIEAAKESKVKIKSLSSTDIKLIRSAAADFILRIISSKGDPLNPNLPGDRAVKESVTLGAEIAAFAAGLATTVIEEEVTAAVIGVLKHKFFTNLTTATFKNLEDQVLPFIEEGLATGENPQHISRRLEQDFGEEAPNKWSAFIRTEVADAINEGKNSEWNAEGIRAVTTIISTPSCPICGPLAGTFEIRSAPTFTADTHPNCTCTSRPATKKEMEAAQLGHLVDVSPNLDLNPTQEDINP